MRELSLFSGAGGGLLGTHHLLGWETIGYVEIDDYCQRVIRQRIEDGLLSRAPIYGDIRAFISEGYAESYKGMVDVITGGDPCQANSAAGSGRSCAKSLGAEFIETVRIIRPRYVIRENPANTLNDAPYPSDRFKEELESMGYAAEIIENRACCMGADHRRARLLVCGELADTKSIGLERWKQNKIRHQRGRQDIRIKTLLTDFSRPNVSDPRAYGSTDGMANRVERSKAIGNGWFPRLAEGAWEILKP